MAQRIEEVSIDALWRLIEIAGPLPAGDELADPNFLEDAERAYPQTARRRSFIARYSWAVPNKEAIAAIAEFARGVGLLEVCAGSGLWARLLGDAGLHVAATDAAPPTVTYVSVIHQDATAAVRAHTGHTALMFCWPPFRNDCAYRALAEFDGDQVIFVGDARFAADAQFHESLRIGWALQRAVAIPSWPGLEDYVYLYRHSGAGAIERLD